MIRGEAAVDELIADAPAGLDAAVADQLRLTGQFAPLLRRARAKQLALAGLATPAGGPELDAALVWFAERHRIDLACVRATNGMASAIWREYAFQRRLS
jgi:hypothetical protein